MSLGSFSEYEGYFHFKCVTNSNTVAAWRVPWGRISMRFPITAEIYPAGSLQKVLGCVNELMTLFQPCHTLLALWKLCSWGHHRLCHTLLATGNSSWDQGFSWLWGSWQKAAGTRLRWGWRIAVLWLFLATSLLSASGKQNSREAAGGQIFTAVFFLKKTKKQGFFIPFCILVLQHHFCLILLVLSKWLWWN